jgi:hypothetical protein
VVLVVVTLAVANSAALTEVIPAAFARDQLSQVVAHVLAGTEVWLH